MKLEQNDQLPLFSSTQIPDIFFSEYLSSANGDFIKVYLYLLFLSKYDKDIKINDLSKKLGLSLNTIQDAIKYWEEQEVLIIYKKLNYINYINQKLLYLLNRFKNLLKAKKEQMQLNI